MSEYDEIRKGIRAEMMRFYSPVGRGVSLLRAQGSISYVQSDEETYDMGIDESIDAAMKECEK